MGADVHDSSFLGVVAQELMSGGNVRTPTRQRVSVPGRGAESVTQDTTGENDTGLLVPGPRYPGDNNRLLASIKVG